MSTASELNASIDAYTAQVINEIPRSHPYNTHLTSALCLCPSALHQLQQVEQAIRDAGGPADREALGQLRDDLHELLRLTRETLDDTYHQPDTVVDDETTFSPSDEHRTSTTAPAADPLDDEFTQFMREIREVDDANQTAAGHSEQQPDDPNDTSCSSDDHQPSTTLEHIKQKLTGLLGTKCSAPHTHAWGGLAYHNAMICGLDDTTEYAAPLREALVCVKVLFTQPTHREMVPCAHYLDGDCRFDQLPPPTAAAAAAAGQQCRYSHGHLVPYGELRAYRQPDYGRLQTRSRWPVLVRRPDGMWHQAHTVARSADGRTCRLRLDGGGRTELADVDYADVLPLHAPAERGSESDGSSDDEDGSADSDGGHNDADNGDEPAGDERQRMQRQHALLVEQSLLTAAPDRPLGEWEKYTRGFGSRMLQKYGYVLGTGLGHEGAGIVVPISAQVLPAGRSLDHCMALREQANGDRNLFSVERRLRQQQRQQEQRDARAEAKRTAAAAADGPSDVFSFMNERVFAGLAADGGGGAGASTASSSNGNGSSSNGNAPTTAAAAAKRRECYADHSAKQLNVRGFQLGEEIRRKEVDVQRVEQSLERHAAGTPVHGRLRAQLDERHGELAALRHSEGLVRREQATRKGQTKLTVF